MTIVKLYSYEPVVWVSYRDETEFTDFWCSYVVLPQD